MAVEYLYKFHLRPKFICDDVAAATPQEKEREVRELAQKLRGALTNLGPTFIKVRIIILAALDIISILDWYGTSSTNSLSLHAGIIICVDAGGATVEHSARSCLTNRSLRTTTIV